MSGGFSTRCFRSSGFGRAAFGAVRQVTVACAVPEAAVAVVCRGAFRVAVITSDAARAVAIPERAGAVVVGVHVCDVGWGEEIVRLVGGKEGLELGSGLIEGIVVGEERTEG